MKVNLIKDGNRITGLACSRENNKCYVCGKPMTSLCDATRKDGKPCDNPMCDEHRNMIATDLDVCDYHNYPKYTEQARQNRINREEARIYFIERYKESNFRVVPGHWPDFATVEEVDDWMEKHEKITQATREDKDE